jgi:hypothetical protein
MRLGSAPSAGSGSADNGRAASKANARMSTIEDGIRHPLFRSPASFSKYLNRSLFMISD